jgi:hypothetical protein
MLRSFMNFFSRGTTSTVLQPRLRIAAPLWGALLEQLRERGGSTRESGAFLLGTGTGPERIATRIVLYDDIDPDCLSEGYIRFDGRHYGRLWEICGAESLSVVADVHTHPKGSGQSHLDRTHPMVSIPGHIALIIPNYAESPVDTAKVGVYVYGGNFCWSAYLGKAVSRVLRIELKGRSK